MCAGVKLNIMMAGWLLRGWDDGMAVDIDDIDDKLLLFTDAVVD